MLASSSCVHLPYAPEPVSRAGWGYARFGGGDVGELGLAPSLPFTGVGVCTGDCQKPIRSRSRTGKGGEGDELITTTGACILTTFFWSSLYVFFSDEVGRWCGAEGKTRGLNAEKGSAVVEMWAGEEMGSSSSALQAAFTRWDGGVDCCRCMGPSPSKS